MSAFTRAAPGTIPTTGSGKIVSPDDLFFGGGLDRFKKIVEGSRPSGIAEAMAGKARVAKFKVEIFDLSDAEQRAAYEELWPKLFAKVAEGSAVVDSRKDLVKHEDGTSYWMRYVEYTIFEPIEKNKEG